MASNKAAKNTKSAMERLPAGEFLLILTNFETITGTDILLLGKVIF